MSEIGNMHIDRRHGYKPSLESIRTMVEQILATFPVQSLIEYKSISKFWYDVISSREFKWLQVRCSKDNVKYIICPDDGVWDWDDYTDVYLLNSDLEIIKTITLPSFNRDFSLVLISSFNGLLCFTNLIEGTDRDICICNPITQKILMLPRGSPAVATATVGVAYDHHSGEYKVFRFLSEEPESEEQHYECEVYSSTTGSWKALGSVECPPIRTALFKPTNDHICVAGKVYWLSWSRSDPNRPVYIVSVDMKEENFKQISLPRIVDVNEFSFLINLDGQLSLVAVCSFKDIFNLGRGRTKKTYIIISVLENPNQSIWAIKSFNNILVDPILSINSVVAMKNEILCIIADTKSKLHYHVYNVDGNYWRMLDGPFPYYLDSPIAMSFAESLSPCRGINGFQEVVRH